MWYFAPILFLTGFTTDLIWTIYIQTVADKSKRKAAAWLSVGTGIVSTIWAEGVINAPLFIPFWWAGLWCGTYYAQDIEQYIKGLWNVKSKHI